MTARGLSLILLVAAALGAFGQEMPPEGSLVGACDSPDDFLPAALSDFRASDDARIRGEESEAARRLLALPDSIRDVFSPGDWLLLARSSERDSNRKQAIEFLRGARAAAARRGESAFELSREIARLEVELEAESSPVAVYSPPSTEARLAYADARRALEAGDRERARELLRFCVRAAPGYVEAAVLLGDAEAADGRTPAAIRAYRAALSSDPSRWEALSGLSRLLWKQPSRAAKEESLALLERAAELRPDLYRLRRESAEHWSQWGDAEKARRQLDLFWLKASPRERDEMHGFRDSLRSPLPNDAPTALPRVPPQANSAVRDWNLALAYARRGDSDSLAAALSLLSEAEKLDPSFGRAPELAAEIFEREGDVVSAEAALRRAVAAEPTRPALLEKLALLLSRQPARRLEARDAWRKADAAGSTEAAFSLAQFELEETNSSRAMALFERYLKQAPLGAHREEAASFVDAERRRRLTFARALAAAGLLAAVLAGSAVARRRRGASLSEWLESRPQSSAACREVVGRLRHECLKHGGLFLSDAARRLSDPDRSIRGEAARLLLDRIEGAPRGLLSSTRSALSELSALARSDGVHLNRRFRDPFLRSIELGLRELQRARTGLRRVASGRASPGETARARARIERAASAFSANLGAGLAEAVDRAGSRALSFSDLRGLAVRVAEDKGLGSLPSIEPLGLFRADGAVRVVVKVERGDWETIWRNLFANGLAFPAVSLALEAELDSDPVTGESLARITLFDDRVEPLTTAMIHGRSADRGLGIVARLVSKYGGRISVEPPGPGRTAYRKGIAVTVPRLEERS